jgi:hypothetical protein
LVLLHITYDIYHSTDATVNMSSGSGPLSGLAATDLASDGCGWPSYSVAHCFRRPVKAPELVHQHQSET